MSDVPPIARVEGVPHIWDRTAPIVARALDLPPATSVQPSV